MNGLLPHLRLLSLPLCTIEEIYKETNRLNKETSEFIRNIDGKSKMTRNEAIKKLADIDPNCPSDYNERFLKRLEALGLLKFEDEKIRNLFKIDNNYAWGEMEWADKATNKFGVICLEEWPEGLVLWVGGEIVWRSWGGTFGTSN